MEEVALCCLGLKRSLRGSFHFVFLEVDHHVQKCGLDYCMMRGHVERDATWRTRTPQPPARAEVFGHMNKAATDPPAPVLHPPDTPQRIHTEPCPNSKSANS